MAPVGYKALISTKEPITKPAITVRQSNKFIIRPSILVSRSSLLYGISRPF